MGYNKMFEEIKFIIDAADSIMESLSFYKIDCEDELERLNGIEELDEFDKARKKQYAAKLDAYNEVSKAMLKWVKSQF